MLTRLRAQTFQGCNQWPDPGDGNTWMHPAAFYYGTMGNFTHWEGDDPQAWSLPYAHPPPHFSEPPVVCRNSSAQHNIERLFPAGTSRTRTRPSA